MFKNWIRKFVGPLFFDILASAVFTAFFVYTFVKTNFVSLIHYDLATVWFMWLSIAFMLNFFWRMHARYFTYRKNPIVIPHPIFICAIALTICVTIGYCYIFVYKLALYGCDKAVEARDYHHMALNSVLRLTIAVYALISFVYVMQRSYIVSLSCKFDRLMRNVINFVFGVIWFRFLLLKALFIIEQFCRDQTNMDSMIKNFCPPYIKNGFTCNTSLLQKEQHLWYRLHYGLLKSAIVTCASELFPVILVAHWIACGRAIKIAAVKNLAQRTVKAYIGNVVPHGTMIPAPARGGFPQEAMQLTLKTLAILLAVLSIVLWLLCFYNYIRGLEESLTVFVQDGIEVFSATIQLSYCFLLFRLCQKIPKQVLDSARSAESHGDHMLLLGSTILLSMECVCELIEVIFFSSKMQTRFVVKLLDIFFSIFSEVANWFEVFSLKKLGALNDQALNGLRNIVPIFAVAGVIFNLSIFVMTYFYIETEKQRLEEVIRSLPNEHFVLIGVVGRILDTANYVYSFTCALCWFDILLRYKHIKLFELGKQFVGYKMQEKRQDGSFIDSHY